MRVFSLDLSTNTGWAVLDDAKLVTYGIEAVSARAFPFPYPMNLCAASQALASNIGTLIEKYRTEQFEIVIEDTNLLATSQRYAQKFLEFIHCSIISQAMRMKINPIFVNTIDWRKATGVIMNASDKQRNAEIDTSRQQAQNAIINRSKEMMDRKWNPLILKSKTKKEERELVSKRESERKELEEFLLKGLRGPKGRIDYKTVSVNRCNELFGTHFRHADNDMAEAILIGYSRFAGIMKP